MKTIVLARHGKSSWDYPVDDKDRPLQLRGITDAHLVARALKAENLEIGHCFASPANRALHTGMIFLRTLGFNLDRFTVSEALYDFSGESVFNFIKALDDHFQTIMIFGHNHAFTALVNMLGDTYLENLPTSGTAIITFNVERWGKVAKGNTQKIITPKSLK